MRFSMYDLSIPIMRRGLAILMEYLDKASAYASENNIDPTVLINCRLAPDMLPLVAQVQRISDNAKGAVGRLAAIEIPSFPDTEKTFSELKERVAKTDAFLQTITPEQLEGSDARKLELRFRSVDGVLNGDTYLMSVLLPNFFFHMTMVHAILRHNGMKVGKKDYLGSFA